MNRLRTLFLMALLLPGLNAGFAQEVKVLDFEAFAAHLAQESDTLYLYNFWATWCKPCVQELPYFEAAQAKYADQKVQIVYVSLDFISHLDAAVKPFVAKKQLQAPVWLLDAPNYNDWLDRISPDWSGSIPASLIAMPSQEIYQFREQSFTAEELNAWLEEILAAIP